MPAIFDKTTEMFPALSGSGELSEVSLLRTDTKKGGDHVYSWSCDHDCNAAILNYVVSF